MVAAMNLGDSANSLALAIDEAPPPPSRSEKSGKRNDAARGETSAPLCRERRGCGGGGRVL